MEGSDRVSMVSWWMGSGVREREASRIENSKVFGLNAWKNGIVITSFGVKKEQILGKRMGSCIWILIYFILF